jgi:hypothetical protein
MRSLLIPYPNSTEFSILYPVPRARLIILDRLLSHLKQEWMGVRFNCDRLVESHWWLFCAIARLLPYEKALPPFNVERLKGEPGYYTLQKLFLADLDESGELSHSQLIQLHLFKPREQPPKEPDAPIDPPFPTSGDADCDILANLMGPFGVDGAIRIYETFDQESIENILYVWNELQKPLEDRRQEYVNRLFLLEMDKEDYQKSLMEEW